MKFDVDSYGILKNEILQKAKKISRVGKQKKYFFFRKLQSQIFFYKTSSFSSNITPHKFRLGPMLEKLRFKIPKNPG